MAIRRLLLVACALGVASPALASGRGGSPRPKPKRMKVTTVVDTTVDGVVVERKLVLRRGGSKRRAKPISLERKVEALKKGVLLNDRPGPLPGELTLKGRLVESAYRETPHGTAIITLVRPGARHFSGPKAKKVYTGGRVRRIEKLTKPVTGRTTAKPTERLLTSGGVSTLTVDASGQWVAGSAQASLTTAEGSPSVHLQAESGDGMLVNWDIDRDTLRRALANGAAHGQGFEVQANAAWVALVPEEHPRAAMAFSRAEIEGFLDGTQPGAVREPPPAARPKAETPAQAAPRRAPAVHRRTGLRMATYDRANRRWVNSPTTASLATRQGSNAIRIQGERNGRPFKWNLSRLALEDALDAGAWETDVFTIRTTEKWVTVAPHERPDARIALPREQVESFLDDTL